VFKHFSITPPENSGGSEKSTEILGSHAKNFFCSMYEMSQRHPVWVAENHVNPCNSAVAGFNCHKMTYEFRLRERLLEVRELPTPCRACGD
jgi:hypothetical protein